VTPASRPDRLGPAAAAPGRPAPAGRGRRLSDDATLAAECARAAEDLEGADADTILKWAVDRYHPGLVIASSMGDCVLVDIAARVQPGLPVLFVDTGYHFPETLGTRDAVAARYPVQMLTIQPTRTVAEQDAAEGPRLYERDPDRCCALRKVTPFEVALGRFTAWASGVRREETSARAGTRVVEWDRKRRMVKVNPLAAWTQDDVDRYIADHDVLVNPLLYDGYPSIGCAPCTRRVAPGEDPRSGRWSGTGKVECGLTLGED
jgi:phosphoadenosine phosphosulfate reductase